MKKITYSKIPLNNFWKEISKDILSPFKPKIPTIINSLIFKSSIYI